jgi:hypothetical protein
MHLVRVPAPEMIRALAAAVKSTNDREDAVVSVTFTGMDAHLVALSVDGRTSAAARFPIAHVPGEMPLRGTWETTAAELRDALRRGDSVSQMDLNVSWDAQTEELRFVGEKGGEIAFDSRLPAARRHPRNLPSLPDGYADLRIHPKIWLQLAEFAGDGGWVQINLESGSAAAVQREGGVMLLRLDESVAPLVGASVAALDIRGEQARAVGYALSTSWSETKTRLKQEVKSRRKAGEVISNQDADRIYENSMPTAQVGVQVAAGGVDEGAAVVLRAGDLMLRGPQPEVGDGMRAAMDAALATPSSRGQHASVPIDRQALLGTLDWCAQAGRLAGAAGDLNSEPYVVIGSRRSGEARLQAYRHWSSDETTERVRSLDFGPARVQAAASSARDLLRALDFAPNAKQFRLGASSIGGIQVSQGAMTVVLPPARSAAARREPSLLSDAGSVDRAVSYELLQARDSQIQELIAEETDRAPEASPIRRQGAVRAGSLLTDAETALFEMHVGELREQGWFDKRLEREETDSLLRRAQAGDQDAEERLNLGHTAFVVRLAHETSNDISVPRRYAVAREALGDAIRRWRPDGGAGLQGLTRTIYRTRLADAAVTEGVYQLSFPETGPMVKMLRTREGLARQLEREPSAREIALALGFDLSNPAREASAIRRVETLLALHRSRRGVTITDFVDSGESGIRRSAEAVIPAPAPTPESEAPVEQRQRLAEMVARLPATESHALRHQYGLGDRFQLSPSEYALYIGMTVETAAERAQEGERRLREALTGFRPGGARR